MIKLKRTATGSWRAEKITKNRYIKRYYLKEYSKREALKEFKLDLWQIKQLGALYEKI